MTKKSAPSKVRNLTVLFTDKDLERLKFVKKKTGLRSNAETVSLVTALADAVVTQLQTGKVIIEKDGRQKEMTIELI